MENKPEVKPATAAAPDDKSIPQVAPVATELNLVERAEKAAKDIAEANAKSVEVAERLEKAKAKEVLGGTAEAGQTPPPPHKDTPEEYADKVSKGLANPLEDDKVIPKRS